MKAYRLLGEGRVWLAALLALGLVQGSAALADDATDQKVVEYYRRKQNIPPDAQITVIDVADAQIPGAKSGKLKIARGAQTQEVALLMSPDGKYVVFGEVEDVTSDPFKAVAAKINTKGVPVRGPKDAKVTIVEYSDFQCPYCARAHQTVSEVMKKYDGKVNLVYKNYPLPFHKWAEPAGIASACAFDQDPAAFWKLYDYYFDNQQQLNEQNIREKSEEQLKGTKVNMAKWKECYDGKKPLERIKAEMAEGQSVGVTGTPAFMINGRRISGAQPLPNFEAVIDDELKRSGGAS